MINIEQLKNANEQALADINVLLPQLRGSAAEHQGTLADLEALVADPSAILIVARENDRIVGMGSLYVIEKVGKRSGYIEDVVVDSTSRGKGVGEKIMQALIEAGRAERLDSIYLTSREGRVAARGLYLKLGFRKHETSVFQLKLEVA